MRAVPAERAVAVAVAVAAVVIVPASAAAARVEDDPTPPANLAVPPARVIVVRQHRVSPAQNHTPVVVARAAAVAVDERGRLRASSRAERSRRQRVRKIGE